MERRLADMGNDRSHWPAVARETVTKLETKQQVHNYTDLMAVIVQ